MPVTTPVVRVLNHGIRKTQVQVHSVRLGEPHVDGFVDSVMHIQMHAC